MLRNALLLITVVVSGSVPVTPLIAQESASWDAPRVLDLVERAGERREQPRADTALRNYHSTASGWIYFYLDRRETEERTLVRVDQVALDVYWAQPDRTKQRIVGLRNESQLPNRMHYHLDHLTVVQNEFGNTIRLGDGDEVRDVPHPAAPGADSIYQFRVADSLTIRLPGAPDPVKVYEIQVRPRDTSRPAYVGSLFIDRSTADIVRMTFTFTPVSYVDRRLDYIHISLDNGLWEGRYWLPYEQRVEIRRQLPELDFVAGAVIKGVLKVSQYAFNEPLPDGLFLGPAVTALPQSLREAHEFEAGLLEGLESEGLAPAPHMEDLRRQAAELLGEQYLSGLPRVRLHIPDASSVLRYNRAEGLFLGGGLSYAPGTSTRVELSGGYAFAAEHGSLLASLSSQPTATTGFRLDGHVDDLRDVGVRPGAAGVWNTFAAAFFGEDYLDPYFASGGAAALTRRVSPTWDSELRLAVEQHESAELAEVDALFDGDADFRAVRPIDDGRLASATATLRRTGRTDAPRSWTAMLSLEAGSLERDVDASADQEMRYTRPALELTGRARSADGGMTLMGSAYAGAALGEVPAQSLWLYGGRGTLPGFPYRGFAADRLLLLDAEASRSVWEPWLRLRTVGAAGWASLRQDRTTGSAADGWQIRATEGVRASAGAGVGLFWDVVRLDLVRGFGSEGETQLLLTVQPRLWDIL